MARPRARRPALLERAVAFGTGFTAIVPFLALVAMLLVLYFEARPSITYSGLHFLTSSTWTIGSLYGGFVTTHGVRHLQGAEFGALPLIVGTLESSAIALICALPVALGAAILIVEKLPARIAGGVWDVSRGSRRDPERRHRRLGCSDVRPVDRKGDLPGSQPTCRMSPRSTSFEDRSDLARDCSQVGSCSPR